MPNKKRIHIHVDTAIRRDLEAESHRTGRPIASIVRDRLATTDGRVKLTDGQLREAIGLYSQSDGCKWYAGRVCMAGLSRWLKDSWGVEMKARGLRKRIEKMEQEE